MIRRMAKNPPNFEVTCPCCSALLKIDVATAAVIAHTAAVKPRMFNDPLLFFCERLAPQKPGSWWYANS